MDTRMTQRGYNRLPVVTVSGDAAELPITPGREKKIAKMILRNLSHPDKAIRESAKAQAMLIQRFAKRGDAVARKALAMLHFGSSRKRKDQAHKISRLVLASQSSNPAIASKASEKLNKIERGAAAGDKRCVAALKQIRQAQATAASGKLSPVTMNRVLDALTAPNPATVRGLARSEAEIGFDFLSKIKNAIASVAPDAAKVIGSIVQQIPVVGPMVGPLSQDAVKSAGELLTKGKKGNKAAREAINQIKEGAAAGDPKSAQALEALQRVNAANKATEEAIKAAMPKPSKFGPKAWWRMGQGLEPKGPPSSIWPKKASHPAPTIH